MYNDFGDTLTLINSTVSNNAADYGGGAFNRGFFNLTNSIVSGNSASQDGGGIGSNIFSSFRLTLLNSTVSGNTAVGNGGGLRSSAFTIVENSTVAGNSAGQFGGGLRMSSGTATFTNSTVSGNFSIRNGGGLDNAGNTTLTNSTVSGNVTGENGGGVRSLGTLNLYQSLISGNTASLQGRELYHAGGTVNANRFNLFGHGGDAGVNSSFSPGPSDLIPGAPLSAILDTALKDNGGPTKTHKLANGSPAIDAGGACFPTTDQRGVPRPQGEDVNGDGSPDCDIGAFEVAVPVPPADLSIIKTDSPDPVLVGQPLTYTLVVRNNGPNNTPAVTVTDLLPGGVSLVSATPSQGSCSGTSLVSCVLGSLGNGGSATVTIVVTPTAEGPLTNTASVAGNPSDPNPGNNSSTIGTMVQPVPVADLSVTKTDSPDPVLVGQPLTYTLTARNNGPNNATGVTVTDTLPPGVTLASATASQGSGCSGAPTVTCSLGSLAIGTTATVTIVVTPPSPGAVSNMASVRGNQDDLNPGNDSATIVSTVVPPPIRADLALTQADAPDPAAVAEPLVYTLAVTNHGPSTATGVQVTDNLSPDVVLAGPPIPNQGTCSGTGLVICHLGTLAIGASATVTLNVLPTRAGTASNAAAVAALEPDIVPGNNSALSTTIINSVAVLPTPQSSCNRSTCGVQLICTLGAACGDRRVTLFVSGRDVRLSEEPLARAPKRIKFAFGIANIPSGAPGTVRLRATSRGKAIIRDSKKKRLEGFMEIRNAAGTIVSNTPITIRLRKERARPGPRVESALRRAPLPTG